MLGKVWISLAIIVTVGVLITAYVTGFAAHWILGIPVTVGLLLGAAMAATDPATLVPVFKQVHVRDKVAQFVVSESALNDPMGAIITFVFLALATGGVAGGHVAVGKDVLELVKEAGIGIGIGLMLGYAGAFFVAHERYGFLMEYLPLVTLIAVIGGYLGAVGLHASGFMAAFVAGLIMGNMHYFGLKMRRGDHARFEDFVGTTSLISRMFIFILLGSQVKLELIAEYWWQGLVVVAVFMFIARPLTVLVSTLPDRRARWSWRELTFIAWTRETGVIPGALASILVGAHAPHADVLAAIIFMAILITIILQATTAKWVAGRLGLLVEKHPGRAASARLVDARVRHARAGISRQRSELVQDGDSCRVGAEPRCLYFVAGPFATGWVLVIEFLGVLVMSLACYPLAPGGLLALEAVLLGLATPAGVYREVSANFPVLLLLMFMVAGIYSSA